MTPKAQATKAKINKWDYNKLKASAQRGNHQQMKRQSTEWEKVFANPTSDKGLL